MSTKKVWFVTGASKGLGLTLVKKLLAEGNSVAATSRNVSELQKVISVENSTFLPLEVNLINENSVSEAISKTVEKFGKLDVIVNNAGYGQLGTLEELTDKESRQNFDTNVFGSLNVIRKSMPYLRAQKNGLVINIASIGGLSGDFPGWGIYCATKFAVVGFTEALAAEAKEFGVNATVVYPGYFRTDFLTGSSLRTPENEIDAYATARKIQKTHEQDINGNQPGDPEKAAVALIELAAMENPPVHLVLGSDAFQMANNKLSTLQNEISDFKTLSISTDY
ncbi:SDR family NAD(P)-dependent oxidoreductase [Epilithonimonas arachidiradicis]|uniref:NADP-dependent 3-hydroxy acid dehydrogenase YdfG n=1 Tax=Epilithonimonas arachidiradicis TaxID=1617282 RepID=A0A420D8W0_9FLAO|nr:SDR family NAD(P)-dependent oxidoreductase [Epilithonimonas arachidiradicis]RKE86975.1 NADP-dependent 3-hydroxy acid dehydrogenase YdfG [Epilithonimonas arachidiradicis]GGG60719.1 short-chain dehydrogenase/reductase [Epilithonimonas arachidiradicis]